MTAGCVTFHPTQTHERKERVFLEPVLAALRLKSLHQVTNFPLARLFIETHKYVGLSHITVVFWDLVFQYQMISESIPGQLGNLAVVLMSILTVMGKNHIR